MKKPIAAMLFALLLITVVGCSNAPEPAATPTAMPTITPSPAESGQTNTPAEPLSPAEPSQTEDEISAMVIRISAGENVVTYQLNDSIAAKNLYAQLPLSLEVENFGSNEKIFYPPQPLDVSDTPQASGGLGVLAYYAPWGDVILFYDDFSRNGSLYELGQVISGSEHIQSIKEGPITIEAVPGSVPTSDSSDAKDVKIKLTFMDQEVVVKLADHPTSQDLLSRLPLSLTFEEYGGFEKLSILDDGLSTEDAPEGYTPKAGDFAYYAPWKDIAIFYADWKYSPGLVKLGEVESGIDELTEKLKSMHDDFTIVIEKMN